MPVNDLITFRKGSAAQWISSNPVLASGEPGFDLTNNIFKIGDGVSSWESLSSHKHNISDINSFASGVADVLNTEMVGGSGISLIYNSENNTITISVTGIVSGSGGGNSGPVTIADITDFNTGVSGLIESIYAPLNSPSFTGIPIVPTASSGSNNNQIANTEFVRNEIASVINSAPEALDTLYELANALGNDTNFATTITNSLSNKASLSGAVFTGSVTIPSGFIDATTLSVTGVPVSVSGHSHSSSDIIGLTSTIESTLDTSLVGGTGIVLSFDQNTQTLSINASNTGLSLSSTDSLPEGSSNLYFTNSRASGASPVQSVAGKTGVITLSASDVGLGNVDNTSDTNKPISLAVQSGLDLKADVVHSHIISDVSGLQSALDNKQSSGNYVVTDGAANFSSLTVNSTEVSLSGHSHLYSDITNFASGVASSVNTELVGGSGISLVYDSGNNTVNISVTGIVSGGGITGPIYTTGIVDFNTGVSGLITDYAKLDSPALTGTPVTPTAPTGTNSNQIASTEFVRNEIASLVASAPSTLDTLNEIALSLNNDANFSSTIVSGLASKASLTGSIFTGSVTIPSGSINADILTVDNIPVSISGHTHIASNISGLDTAITDQLDTSIVAGSGITFTYDSGSSILTISTTGVSSGGGSGLSWSSVPSGSTDSGSAGQIAYDDNYFYIATSTNTWKRALLSKWPLVSMNYLLVAGGGGGGGGRGAGGGAGGYVYSATSVPVGESISVVVGDGGSGSTNSVTAQNGSNSSITLPSSETVVALGGGGGADGLKGLFTGSGMSGASGGSGGGGSGYNPVGSGGSGTVDQGYAGGAGYGGGEPYNGGGGGGAGGAGGSGQIANGGVGKADTILAVTSAGVDVGGTRYIAGGGGAGSYNYTPGTGGIGGGGDGGNTGVNGNNAVANTGGGGGGGGNGADGGSGGSGIVILRCPDSFTATTTGSPTIYVTGGYRYYKFTQNGTITFATA